MRAKKAFYWGVILTISISLLSCDFWFDSHKNPLAISAIANKRNGKKVYVSGKVIRAVPLVNNGAYQLQDKTGKVWVLTNTKLPSLGDKISIQGAIQYQELPFSEEELYLQELDIQNYSLTNYH